MGAVEVLVEIEQVEQVVLSFKLSVLLIQFDQILGGTVPLFLNEANVVLLLELEHFIFAVPQIFFDLNELLGNSGRNFVAAVLAHSAFEIEILLHDCIQIGLGVLGRAANRSQVKNGSARLLQDRDFNRNRLQFRVRGTNERFSAMSHFRALHQLNLCPVKIDAVLAVNRALRDVQLSCQHHFTGRKVGRRHLVNEKRLDK